MITGAKIAIGLYDSSIEEDTSLSTTSSNSPYADADILLNNQDTEKVAYLEKDYLLLDGSFIFPAEGETVNVGWESGNLSDESGIVNEFIQYEFENTHASFGIQIEFPEETIPKDFSIVYLDAEGGEILRTKVTDNALKNYSNYEVALDWKTIRIEITRINNPLQRARIKSLRLGITDVYDENLLIEISASRTTDLTADNSDSGQLDVTFYNAGRFNISSIIDLPEGVQHDVKIVSYFKDRNDIYQEFGHYISKETNVSDEGKLIKITAYDALYDLNYTYYSKGVVYINGRSLKEWAQEVADDAGIEIEIDDAFASIISKGYIAYTTHREALRQIAEAGCGLLKIDRSGKAYLKKISSSIKSDITADDIVDGTFEIVDSEKNLGVTVNNYVYGSGTEKVGVAEIQGILLTEAPQTIEVEYASAPADVESITVQSDTTSGIQIVEQYLYSDRARFVITGPEGNIAWITMLGKVYSVATNVILRGSTQGNIKEIDNPLIAGVEMAENVAQYQYDRLVGVYEYSADIVTDENYDLEDETNLNGESVYITKIQKTMSESDAKESVSAWNKQREVRNV